MPNRKHISEIDDFLKKYQFLGIDAVWNRDCGDFIDVIDLQVDKLQEKFTVNIGVAEKSILELCWSLNSLSSVDEPSCTIRARLGALMCGRDIWWPLSGVCNIEEILHGLEKVAIPFIQKNHSIDMMIEFLEDSPSGGKYPPEAVYLALLYDRKGEGERSREMLRALHAKVVGSWRQKVSEILHALN